MFGTPIEYGLLQMSTFQVEYLTFCIWHLTCGVLKTLLFHRIGMTWILSRRSADSLVLYHVMKMYLNHNGRIRTLFSDKYFRST